MNYHGELARAGTRRHEAAYPARGRDGYELATRLFLDWTKTEPAALTEEHVREPYIHVMQSREPSGDKSWPFPPSTFTFPRRRSCSRGLPRPLPAQPKTRLAPSRRVSLRHDGTGRLRPRVTSRYGSENGGPLAYIEKRDWGREPFALRVVKGDDASDARPAGAPG